MGIKSKYFYFESRQNVQMSNAIYIKHIRTGFMRARVWGALALLKEYTLIIMAGSIISVK